MKNKEPLFTLIDFDGWNLGLRGDFCSTYLEFDDFYEAADIAWHWESWCYNG